MSLSRVSTSALIGALAVFLVHCSDQGDNSQSSGGSANGGSANGGSANGGVSAGNAAGGSSGGVQASGGSANGGANTAGATSAGASNGAGASSGGATSSGGMASAGASGSNPQGGAPSSAGGSNANGGSANGGSAGSNNGGASGSAGKGGSSAGQSAGGQGGGSGMTLTSSKLTAGMAFPSDFTCAGTDKSPPFAWSNAPSGTLSFALVLTDMTLMPAFNHWVLWDVPAATMTLDEGLASGATLTTPSGAKQKAGFGSNAAYVGPCPNGTMHTYVFTLYALDVATLPNVTSSTSVANIVSAIQMHDLASATLSATSDARNN